MMRSLSACMLLAMAVAELVDKETMCSSWAAAGECQYNAEYMSTTCAKSCSEVPPNPAGEPEQCASWATQGECTRNPCAATFRTTGSEEAPNHTLAVPPSHEVLALTQQIHDEHVPTELQRTARQGA